MVSNRIKEILEEEGFAEVRPSPRQLNEMGTNLIYWNKWVEKKRNPAFHQIPAVARFLGCEIKDLFIDQKGLDDLASKYKLSKK